MASRPDMETLLKRAQAGDGAAFEEALSAHEARLRGFVITRMGSQLRGDIEAEDVLQETYTSAFASIQCFQRRGPDSFLRWLNHIAEHVILCAVRKRRNRASAVLFLEQDIASRDPAPSKAARREERMARLQQALDGLSPEYREAIYLVRIEGQQVKEAACRMGRSPKSVMHLLSRGLRKLKEAFGDTESMSLPQRSLRREDAGHGS